MTPELVAITARAGAAMKSQSGPAMLQPRIWGAFYRSAGAKVAAIVIHPTSNFMGHYMLQPLAQRGIPTMGLNTRYAGTATADGGPDRTAAHCDHGVQMRQHERVDGDVAKTHSRPHVSDDNPYSEAQFKTLRYRPDFPDRFGSIEDARAHCRGSSSGTITNTATAESA